VAGGCTATARRATARQGVSVSAAPLATAGPPSWRLPRRCGLDFAHHSCSQSSCQLRRPRAVARSRSAMNGQWSPPRAQVVSLTGTPDVEAVALRVPVSRIASCRPAPPHAVIGSSAVPRFAGCVVAETRSPSRMWLALVPACRGATNPYLRPPPKRHLACAGRPLPGIQLDCRTKPLRPVAHQATDPAQDPSSAPMAHGSVVTVPTRGDVAAAASATGLGSVSDWETRGRAGLWPGDHGVRDPTQRKHVLR